MLEFISNLIILLVAAIGVGYIIWKFYSFVKMPAQDQFTMVREWLLWAVAEAEKMYGSGTGVLKLRYVYDMFLSRFGELEYLISFEDFSKMVDEALEALQHFLETNEKINSYVEGTNEEAR